MRLIEFQERVTTQPVNNLRLDALKILKPNVYHDVTDTARIVVNCFDIWAHDPSFGDFVNTWAQRFFQLTKLENPFNQDPLEGVNFYKLDGNNLPVRVLVDKSPRDRETEIPFLILPQKYRQRFLDRTVMEVGQLVVAQCDAINVVYQKTVGDIFTKDITIRDCELLSAQIRAELTPGFNNPPAPRTTSVHLAERVTTRTASILDLPRVLTPTLQPHNDRLAQRVN